MDRHGRSRGAGPSWASAALHLLVASSFAVAQPVFDLLGRNTTFFVAHRSTRGDILLLTALLLLGPPLVLLALEALAALVGPAVRRVAHALFVAALVALAVLPPVLRAFDPPVVLVAGAFAAAALGLTVVYLRNRWSHTLLSVAGPAPLVFAGLFLLASPVSDLVFPPRVVAHAAGVRKGAPIVVMLFDELSLGTLLTPDQRIDGTRFPNLARLAGMATWYPQASGVSPWTLAAVPALISGRLPAGDLDTRPDAASYPDNLFTLLGGSYDVRAWESVTALCPTSICETAAAAPRRLPTLFEDVWIAYLHETLPASTAADWLPPISSQWAGFAGADDEEVASPAADGDGRPGDVDPHRDPRGLTEAFLSSIEPTGGPTLWFLHTLLPHHPWRYTGEGDLYGSEGTPGMDRATRWVGPDHLIDQALQRHLLQTQFVDTVVGRALDRLEEIGILDEALVVVTADHGLSFAPGKQRRGFEADDIESATDQLSVPLLLKLPGQTEPRVDDRNAETVDVLPSIAQAVGVDLPFDTDGSPLAGPDPRRSHKRMATSKGIRELPAAFEGLDRMARRIEALLGPGGSPDDVYVQADDRSFVGRPVEELAHGPPAALQVELDRPSVFAAVDPDSGFVPVRLAGRVAGGGSGGTRLAVAVNGRVAGVASTYTDDAVEKISVLLSPRFLAAGANQLEMFEVGPGDVVSPVEITNLVDSGGRASG